MTTTPEHLFVYGTLMQSIDNPMAQLLRANAIHVGPAEFHGGKLYRISWYPGLIESDDPSEIVHGDLFRLSPDIGAAMVELDAYESIGPAFQAPYEYRRELREVTCDGAVIETWVYIYNWSVEAGEYLSSGRFTQDT